MRKFVIYGLALLGVLFITFAIVAGFVEEFLGQNTGAWIIGGGLVLAGAAGVWAAFGGLKPKVQDREQLERAGDAGPELTDVPDKVFVTRLPRTGAAAFGREKELAELHDLWQHKQVNIVTIVAWGGVGKTALVLRWLGELSQNGFKDDERVFAWSFYSQGTTERAVSADQFVAEALKFFGDPDPAEGSPTDKGERLARLVAAQRTLLILDGLEPLQYPPGPDEGRLKDPSVSALLLRLAIQNPGLCVITTRANVADLESFFGNAVRPVRLENLSVEAGVQLLESLAVKGTKPELEAPVREFKGHALAIRLLGGLLTERYGGDIRRWRELPPLETEDEKGGQARRVMASYEVWFERGRDLKAPGGLGRFVRRGAHDDYGPELGILRMLGLFNRPADAGAVEELRKKPPSQGVTDKVVEMDEARWANALGRLRRLGLVAFPDPGALGELDAHPLVRQHFEERLKRDNEKGWREANSRLFDYYQKAANPLPETVQAMQPLYWAVAHGCQAGRHQEALDDVYYSRIQRGDEIYNRKKLGALGADLATLSAFFDPPWGTVAPVIKRDRSRGYLLADAGSVLKALGRLEEAVEPMCAGLELVLGLRDWQNASRAAYNLSELHTTLGRLDHTLEYAQNAKDYADHSNEKFEQIVFGARVGTALHQLGRRDEALPLFEEAERMQEKFDPAYPQLCSLQGYWYCDLLLDRGETAQVIDRSQRAMEVATRNGWLLDIALDNLSLGGALMMRAQAYGPDDASALRHAQDTAATRHMDAAVDGLRRAGRHDYLPLGLLARSEVRRRTGDLPAARADVDEAYAVATRSKMRLHEPDCHLQCARLLLSERKPGDARKHLDTAKNIINETSYHRRDGEVADLEKQLSMHFLSP